MIGRRANEVKRALETALSEQNTTLQQAELVRALQIESLDVTLPGRPIPRGRIHPVTSILRQIAAIFTEMGFQVYRSREVETDPKPVRDNRCRSVQVYRYRCCHCRRTFRYYPTGVDRADQTLRLRKLVALHWVLGMSLRSVTLALAPFGVKLSHMTVFWRDLQQQADLLAKQRRWQPVRVLGLDGAYPLINGKKSPVLIAVDLGNGQPVAIGQVDESNPQAVKRWLEPLVKRLGVSVIVTDDLSSFRNVAPKLGLEHQVCQFHLRRWGGRKLRDLQETVPKQWQAVLEQARIIVDELPIDGDRQLLDLYRQVGVARQAPHQTPVFSHSMSAKPKPSPKASAATEWKRVVELVQTSRAMDAIEETTLVPGKKIFYQFSARGHDMAQVLLGLHLTHPKDAICGYYRSRPILLSLGVALEDALGSAMGRAGGYSDGRDIGVVFNYPNAHSASALPMCGGVGAQYTPTAGYAQAIEYHKRVLGDRSYDGAIGVVLGGDASVATNGFWSALTMATRHY